MIYERTFASLVLLTLYVFMPRHFTFCLQEGEGLVKILAACDRFSCDWIFSQPNHKKKIMDWHVLIELIYNQTYALTFIFLPRLQTAAAVSLQLQEIIFLII